MSEAQDIMKKVNSFAGWKTWINKKTGKQQPLHARASHKKVLPGSDGYNNTMDTDTWIAGHANPAKDAHFTVKQHDTTSFNRIKSYCRKHNIKGPVHIHIHGGRKFCYSYPDISVVQSPWETEKQTQNRIAKKNNPEKKKERAI